jgi:hypothetical protein
VVGLAAFLRRYLSCHDGCKLLGEVLAHPSAASTSHLRPGSKSNISPSNPTQFFQPALTFSHAIIRRLHIPARCLLSYTIHLSTAFLLSAVAHIINVLPVANGYYPIRSLCRDSIFFFGGQIVAILAESVVIGWYREWFGDTAATKVTERGLQKKVLREDVWMPLLGYMWVLTWLAFSGWWFVKLYTGIGVLKWTPPFPLAESALRWIKVI